MKFQFTKIVLPIDLGEYHESYTGKALQVWVNPPREKKRERERLVTEYARVLGKMVSAVSGEQLAVSSQPSQQAVSRRSGLSKILALFKRPLESTEQDEIDAINRKIFAWMAEIWSQHEDPDSHCSVAEIQRVYDVDPTLYTWMTRRTIELMAEFRTGQKKV